MNIEEKRNESAQEPAFDCAMCGSCCEGKGGIVVSDKDLTRLCRYLELDAATFERLWGERRGGKLHVRATQGGACVFFARGKGCAVHIAKPDICRAWPFFRGNLIDRESFFLARGFCPGISPARSHEAFVREGLEYLVRENLAGSAGEDEAGALQVEDLLAGMAHAPEQRTTQARSRNS